MYSLVVLHCLSLCVFWQVFDFSSFVDLVVGHVTPSDLACTSKKCLISFYKPDNKHLLARPITSAVPQTVATGCANNNIHVDRLVGHPIIACGPNAMIGQTFYGLKPPQNIDIF